MPVEEVPSQFKASDGQSFSTKQAAERHEALVSARQAFEQIQRQYYQALAQTGRTADGALFTLEGWNSYYHLTTDYAFMPVVRQVSFYAYADFDTVREEDQMVLVVRDYDQGRYTFRRYRLADLYASEAHADRALLTAREAWLAERAAEVEALRAEIAAKWG